MIRFLYTEPMKSDNSQGKILHLIKTRGPRTVAELARELGMTKMGVRQHLAQLVQARLLKTEQRPSRRGRPGSQWCLTQAGHRSFADGHESLTAALIRSVTTVFGEQGLDRLIEQRTLEALASYRAAMRDCSSLQERVHRLARLRSDEGYMAWVERDDEDYLLIENHCPICAAAQICQGFCRSELETFQAVLGDGVKVERTDHIFAGARRCAYRISKLM